MLTLTYALHGICGFIKSVQVQLIALLRTEILCTLDIPVRSYLLLMHLLRKLTSGMTNFMLNPPSNILVIQLANVVVILMQFLHVSLYCGKNYNHAIQTKLRGNVYNMCVWKKLLYFSDSNNRSPVAACCHSINALLPWNRLRFHGHLLPCIMLMVGNKEINHVRGFAKWFMWICSR